MDAFADIDWSSLNGGYRVPYDPRPALTRLDADPDDAAAWDELWQELHHQGDVGEASYAAVPVLAKLPGRLSPDNWNLYALVACIEARRGEDANPELPETMASTYHLALAEIAGHAIQSLTLSQDELVKRSALGVVALAHGLRYFGQLISEYSEDEVRVLLGPQGV